jgi:hypothetical protein
MPERLPRVRGSRFLTSRDRGTHITGSSDDDRSAGGEPVFHQDLEREA